MNVVIMTQRMTKRLIWLHFSPQMKILNTVCKNPFQVQACFYDIDMAHVDMRVKFSTYCSEPQFLMVSLVIFGYRCECGLWISLAIRCKTSFLVIPTFFYAKLQWDSHNVYGSVEMQTTKTEISILRFSYVNVFSCF